MLRTLLLLCFVATGFALPTWEGLNPRADFMSALVPSMTYIEVLGAVVKTQSHLCSHIPGEPGNLTFAPQSRGPQLFALAESELYLYKNQSSVFPVIVKNTTHLENVPPLQLVLGKQTGGDIVPGGRWKWKGTMLRYELASNSNSGIFYSCPTGGTSTGIFMFLTPAPTPAGCHILTLHSFAERQR